MDVFSSSSSSSLSTQSYSSRSTSSSSSSSSKSSFSSSSSLTTTSVSSVSSSSQSSSTILLSTSSSQSSSTYLMTTSSSSQSSLSTSSSCSDGKGTCGLGFTFEGAASKAVNCFLSYSGKVYAGTSPDGKVLMSSNLSSWTTFVQLEDPHIRSLFGWANAIFIGTEPSGSIYVHNFTTNKFYKFVQTEDHAVTAMAEYGGKLFVGTSPRGIIYTFDGVKWEEIHRAYGHGINALIVSGGKIYALAEDTESPLVYDGEAWKLATDVWIGSVTLQKDTTSSMLNIATPLYSVQTYKELPRPSIRDVDVSVSDGTIVAEDKPALTPDRKEFSLSSGIDNSGSLIYGGRDFGGVYTFNGSNISKVFATDEGGVSAIAKITPGIIAVACGSVLYALGDVTVENDSSSSSSSLTV